MAECSMVCNNSRTAPRPATKSPLYFRNSFLNKKHELRNITDALDRLKLQLFKSDIRYLLLTNKMMIGTAQPTV